MPETLAQKIKAKYPGTYDDIPDAELEQRITAKYPGVYDDIPRTDVKAAATAPAPERTWADTAKDALGGVRAGIANTVYGGGDIIRRATGMERIIDTPEVKAAMTPPASTAGKVGMAAEQIGEFFLPTGLAGTAGKVAEVAKAGALTAAQTGGNPTATAASAGLTAAVPVAGALASKASGALKESAANTMANALRATKEWAKDESAKLAPEMLKRGIGGTFRSMRTLARETAAKVGANLEDAYKAATAAGETVPGDVVRGNIQLASDALHVVGQNGKRIPLPGHEAAIGKLAELDDFISKLGPDIPVDKAAYVKRAWDQIVSSAGLYGNKATAPASEKAQAWAYREAANSFREMLNTNPTIEALNKEAAFWIGLRNVLDATKLRKVGQTGGLIRAGGAAVGAGVGGMTGDSASERGVNAVLGGLAGQKFIELMQSPLFMSKVSAPLKNALADALASGDTGRIRGAVARITASAPAQLATGMAR